MRSLILTLLALVLLGGAFAAVVLLSGDPPAQTTRTPRSDAPTTRPAGDPEPVAAVPPPATQGAPESVIGAGDNVWVQSYNRETGKLMNEFRAARYDPPENGQVHVQRPEARFYARNGQVMTVAARDGQVVMPEQPKRSGRIEDIQGAPPAHGTLYDVTLALFESADAPTPVITCKLPVISFDNDASRIETIQHEIDGRIVPKDRIPVVVTGQYEFEGQGLTVRWNEVDQRLESLEIAHGKRLLVKDPSQFGGTPLGRGATSDERPATMSVRSARGSSLSPSFEVLLASADAAAVAEALREQKRARRQEVLNREVVAYRASFVGDITIFEGDTQIGSADELRATFTFEDDPKPAEPRKHATPSAPTTQANPATRPARQAEPKAPKAPQQPVEIRWTGKLTLAPVEFADSSLMSAGDRIVEFTGKPVTLAREGASIEAARVVASSETERFVATNDAGPVVVKDPSGMTLVTSRVEMAGDIATISGASSATLDTQSKEGKPQTLLVKWSDKGTLRLGAGDGAQRSIESAKFEGKVDVQHPQLALSADTLKLAFASGKGDRPLLKAADATGSVKATLKGEGDVKQTVSAEALSVATEPTDDGKDVVFRTFRAAGEVVLADAGQTLRCQRIDASMRPADESGKIEIDTLTAEGKVAFKGPQGAASADVLSIATRDGVQFLTLQGAPATLTDEQSTLAGKLIKLDSTGAAASVVGAGSLEGLARAGQAKQPVHVAWTQSLDYSASKNRADVAGDVVISSKGADGSTDRATGKRLHLELADADTKQTEGAIGRKIVKSIRLEEDVEVSSTLRDGDTLLRRINVLAPGVSVAMTDAGELGAVTIPSGGRMLYEDRRDNAPATQPAQSMRGAVAVQWGRSMSYDPKANQVTLEGDVVVVHQPKQGDAMRMLTNKLIAELAGEAGQQQQLKLVRASEGASFITPQVRFDASEAIYDPVNERVIARGSDRLPVEVFDQTGVSSGSFEELWWDLKANRPERLKNVTGAVRR